MGLGPLGEEHVTSRHEPRLARPHVVGRAALAMWRFSIDEL
jgi:hypothetical protein